MYSSLSKGVLKALFVKCTELEDYELADLRDLYFNPHRAEAEGAFDRLNSLSEEENHTHDNDNSH